VSAMSDRSRMMRAMRAIIVFVSALLSMNEGAQAQVDCTAIMNEMRSIGPAYGSYERTIALGNIYNNNCLGGRVQQPAPVIPPRPYEASPPPPVVDEAERAVLDQFERLGNSLMGAQPLRRDIPLSSGVVPQETYVPPPPENYVDPFAERSSGRPAAGAKRSTGTGICPPNMREVRDGDFTSCELYIERRPD
jgi:hypothetical protein